MMSKKFYVIAKFTIFLVITASLIGLINNLFIAKYMYDQAEPHTETYSGFYQMDKNTIDVLVLGTSHAASGFNPQDFYDAEQLRTYNLSSSAQPVWASYYWLKEALKYQKPSVVIFECNYLFSDYMSEGANRKTLDNMRLGKEKYDAVMTAVETDKQTNESALSYFLPYIRYHSRWKKLNEKDFMLGHVERPSVLKGFWFYPNISNYKEFKPLVSENVVANQEEFEDISFKYFEKLVRLCEDKNIQLIITKTPCHLFSMEMHNAVQAYANEMQLPFYDFNMDNLYNETGFNYELDTNDAGLNNAHANPSGARKLSVFLAKEILKNGWANSCKDNQWEKSREFNKALYKDFELINTTDINNYLNALQDKRYTIFISVRDEATVGMNKEVKSKLKKLGLRERWGRNALQHSYLAVIDKGTVVYEELSSQKLIYKNSFRDGLMRIDMSSAGFYVGNLSSIKINNMEESQNKRGFNIVVYDNNRQCIIDSVNFDTWNPEIPCQR